MASPELPNFWNIRINGQKRAVHENRNMWGTFTSETASPFMEFDFIGADGFEQLGRTRAEVEALGPGAWRGPVGWWWWWWATWGQRASIQLDEASLCVRAP